MIDMIISGGQSGADQAGLRAARRFGIRTGGWAPAMWRTEFGEDPSLGWIYGLREHESPDYSLRTKANVRDSDLTLWFEWTKVPRSPGYKYTFEESCRLDKPFLIVYRHNPELMVYDITPDIKIVNIAGSRESRCPGIGVWVESACCELFRLLGFKEIEL